MSTDQLPTGCVAVGYDGSARARHAAFWAAREAERRGCGLHLLYSFPYLTSAREYDVLPVDDLVAAGDRVVGALRDQIVADHPDLTVTTQVTIGRAAEELVAASAEAALVVVGARGLGRVSGPLLGSVSQKVAAHAHGPVVVVREDAQESAGPVVVGLDPVDGSPEAVLFAFEEARRRGTSVLVVHAIDHPPVLGEYVDAQAIMLIEEVNAAEDARVRGLVDTWRERYPDVPVDLQQPHEPAVAALSRAARDACLLVVGSRGHGGLAGLLLGSVSRGVLHHAPLVAVVRVVPAAAGAGH